MLYTAKGKTNEEAGEATNEEEGADPVSLLELLRKREFGRGIHTNEVGCDNKPDTAEWVVDVEAPDAACQYSSMRAQASTHQRHDACSTRLPPTTGPTMLPMDQAPRTIAKYFGRCLNGTMSQKMTWVTVMMPPPPIPCMERPVSSTVKL